MFFYFVSLFLLSDTKDPIIMTFDSTFTSNNDTTSLRKKIVVGGAIALLLGVATYSSNGRSPEDRFVPASKKNLLRSTQGTETDLCPHIESQVQGAIGNINDALAQSEDPLVLEQDAEFTKKDVPLDDSGCKGDITITISKGASVSGLSDTKIGFDQKECSFDSGTLKGTWILLTSSPSITVEATVTTKATNCDIDKSGSVTITVLQPILSSMASASVDVGSKSVVIEEVKLDEVVVGFDQAGIDLVPGGSHNFTPAEGAAINKYFKDIVLPKVNGLIAAQLPKTIKASEAVEALYDIVIWPPRSVQA